PIAVHVPDWRGVYRGRLPRATVRTGTKNLMRPIAEFQWIHSRLAFWQGYDPAVKTDVSCCAVLAEAGLIFVDPLPLADDVLCELTESAIPAGIVLTNENHLRSSEEFAKRFEVPIRKSANCEDGATIFGDMRVIHLPGFAPGEMAVHCGTTLMIGDALINLEPHGFSILPEKYCTDVKAGRISLHKLLQFDFDTITFAHGLPIVTVGRARLEALLQ
ncbi:MAG: hypothetical protein M3O82_04225, partial [Verrucomicrobiota bacterium]|nr:hypothetical protein [Verrucomicrobiota bacterium]